LVFRQRHWFLGNDIQQRSAYFLTSVFDSFEYSSTNKQQLRNDRIQRYRKPGLVFSK